MRILRALAIALVVAIVAFVGYVWWFVGSVLQRMH